MNNNIQKLNALQIENNTLKGQNLKANKIISEKDREIANLNQQIQQLSTKLQNITNENERLNNKNKQLQLQNKSYQATIQEQQKTIDDMTEQLKKKGVTAILNRYNKSEYVATLEKNIAETRQALQAKQTNVSSSSTINNKLILPKSTVHCNQKSNSTSRSQPFAKNENLQTSRQTPGFQIYNSNGNLQISNTNNTTGKYHNLLVTDKGTKNIKVKIQPTQH